MLNSEDILEPSDVETTPTSDPQNPGFNVFLNYICTRDPTVSEPLIYNGYPYLPQWWQTSGTNDFFLCLDNTADAMLWEKMITSRNFSAQLAEEGIIPAENRNWVARSSPAFSTSYQPSIVSDTSVVFNIRFSSLISLAAEVDIQVSTNNSTWVTVTKLQRNLSLASTFIDCVSITVPISSYYRAIIISGGATPTIDSILELSI